MLSPEQIDALLADISADAPCGPNLEYDADYLRLQQLATGRPEQQFGDTIIAAEEPDWLAVERLASSLFARTKDLRVAALLTRSWTELRGIAGYAAGVRIVNDLTDRHWDTVYPLLDDEGEPDPVARINALSEIAGPDGCANAARRQALVTGGFGDLSVRDAERVLDGVATSVEHYPGGAERLRGELQQAQAEPRSALQAALDALDALETLRGKVAERLGSEWAFERSDFEKALLRIRRDVLRPPPNESDVPGPAVAAAEDPGSDGAASCSTERFDWRDAELASRDDVRVGLEKMCRYFEVYEPSHPAPLLLRRAQRLLGLDFYEIIRDLVPDSLSQLDALGGVRRAE